MGRMNKFVTLKYTKCEVLLKSSEVMKLFQFEIQRFKRVLYAWPGSNAISLEKSIGAWNSLEYPHELGECLCEKKKSLSPWKWVYLASSQCCGFNNLSVNVKSSMVVRIKSISASHFVVLVYYVGNNL